MPDNPMAFTPQQALEFMQKMWNPLGLVLPGMTPPAAGTAASGGAAPLFPNPMALFASIDPGEIGKKIAELRIIENWLAMSLSFMQMSIKTLELQQASLETLRASSTPVVEPAPVKTKSKTKEGG